jgi:DNA polymerase-3 subunit delta'
MSNHPNQCFPWQTSIWDHLRASQQNNRLPHAILLTGDSGMGKAQFAQAFAQSLLCTNRNQEGHACMQCRGCQLFQAGTHPDFTLLSPEEEGKNITVDQVRRLGSYFSMTSQYEGFRVAIITPAERMNAAAANSLLKTLEEPPAQTLLLLVSSQSSWLLPTVRSRCQQIHFQRPGRDITLPWLKAQLDNHDNDMELLLNLSNEAPLKALKMAQDNSIQERHALFNEIEDMQKGLLTPADIAERCLKRNPKQVIDWLSSWVSDLIRLGLSEKPPGLVNQDLVKFLHQNRNRLDLLQAFRYLDRLHEALRLSYTQVNMQMLLEDMFIGWRTLITIDTK